MPLLQVQDFPDDVYKELSFVAQKEHRTIAQQTIVFIQRGLGKAETNKERRRRVLEEIMAQNVPEAAKSVDVVTLIREDHER
ncbi:hypothetical protein FACS1894200_10640 [Spirochaetia bacterium]|nr:hypothetical protein FACS1894200_10640 [Spirochaetia bacterium]